MVAEYMGGPNEVGVSTLGCHALLPTAVLSRFRAFTATDSAHQFIHIMIVQSSPSG